MMAPKETRPTLLKQTQIVVLLACAVTACVTAQKRNDAGRLMLDVNQVKHSAGQPYFCFAFVANGQERRECSVSSGACEQRAGQRKDEKSEVTSPCRPVEGAYCFAFAEGETNNAQCYETEPDCSEQSDEISRRVGQQNVSGCQRFDTTHQSY